MKIINYSTKKNSVDILKRNSEINLELKTKVQNIILDIKTNKDLAIFKAIKNFEGLDLKTLATAVPKKIVLEDSLASSIRLAIKQIYDYHLSQKSNEPLYISPAGVKIETITRPIERVGLYIPGGTAPLFSTFLMLAIPAMIAGIKEIIICSPAQKNGEINKIILFCARELGFETIYRIGGAQAIAAMTFGCKEFNPVFKIFGPGNAYVTLAKQLVQEYGVAIDMPAGPSELAFICDEFANAEFIAADLLAQAEHGTDSQVVCVSTSSNKIDEIQKSLLKQLKVLERKEITEQALEKSAFILCKNKKEMIEFINNYAPEHLSLCLKDAELYVKEINNAGTIFVGELSAESFGDYATGSNHTLPTNGYAKSYSGLSLRDFSKRITVQTLDSFAVENLAPAVSLLALNEGLQGHERAALLRLKKFNKKAVNNV